MGEWVMGRGSTEARSRWWLLAAARKLEYVDLAARLDDLKVPPGNRLHALRGDRKGQHAIAINDQWRICF